MRSKKIMPVQAINEIELAGKADIKMLQKAGIQVKEANKINVRRQPDSAKNAVKAMTRAVVHQPLANAQVHQIRAGGFKAPGVETIVKSCFADIEPVKVVYGESNKSFGGRLKAQKFKAETKKAAVWK